MIKVCPLCSKNLKRNFARHFDLIKDNTHKIFYNEQMELAVKYFLESNSPDDISKTEGISMNKKWIYRHVRKILGKERFLSVSKIIFANKRKNYWSSFSEEERKKKMSIVRNAEWSNLNPEQRKKHPWVIAGRKASLESTIKGSRNQKYAFELLKTKLPNYNWIYNYVFDGNWQIDIAAPEQKIFIEWDGRHHRVPIHGETYLNNRKNRDCIKNKIVTEQLNGTMIRVNDGGRFDKEFVEEKVEQIVEILCQKIGKNQVLLLEE